MGVAPTPASDHLSNIRGEKDSSLLDEERLRAFHESVVSFLFVATRCRSDIQTEVSLLCTRALHPDYDDWRNFKRLLKLIRDVIYLKLTLGTLSLA